MSRGLTSAEAALFKAYDIRGPAPAPLSPMLAFRVGAAFAGHLGGGRIGVARDARATSPRLAAAFTKGLATAGAEVHEYGVLPTDAMWFAVREHQLDGGAVITASHNPPGDNGIKLVGRGAAPVFRERGLPEVQDRAARAREPDLLPETPPDPDREIVGEYRAFFERIVDFRSLPALRIVFDAGNGVGGLMAERVLAGLPGEAIRMHFEPDGSFPNRGPNPLDPKNREPLARRVLEERADFGVLWDGDADRCAFVDGDGIHLPGDFTTALLAPLELAGEPGGRIVFDLRSSRAVPDAIRAAGGIPRPTRVGHAYLKERMAREDAVFGGELSGHFFFRATGYTDNALLPILKMIRRIGDRGRSLAELGADLRRRYFTVDEVSIGVVDTSAALARVREAFSGGSVDETDGLTMDFSDWRFTLRPSNTEPVLRLTLEAFRPGLAEARRDRIVALLGPLTPAGSGRGPG